MHLSEIDTPAIVVDLDILDRNLTRVADYSRQHRLRLRPHTKTHKSVFLSQRQLESGAMGLTVAKVSEAEVMVEAGPRELLVAFPIIGRAKLDRLMEVARRTRVTVAVDSAFAARQISQAAQSAQVEIAILAEMDAGLGRVGVAPGQELLDLAREIQKLPNLVFEGITFYAGQIKSLDEAGLRTLAEVGALLRSTLHDFRAAGIEVKVVSGGSTPTLFHSHELEGLTEIRPGTYIFNDVNTVQSGGCRLEDCAASVLVTVVSTPRPGAAMADGGSKTFSSDRPANPADVTFGYIQESPETRFHKMNEEHGFLDISRAERTFAIGDRLRIVPNHICVAINLHDKVYGIRGETVERVWTVDARGKLQ